MRYFLGILILLSCTWALANKTTPTNSDQPDPFVQIALEPVLLEFETISAINELNSQSGFDVTQSAKLIKKLQAEKIDDLMSEK